MNKIIKIADTEVTLSNNVAWTMEYRDQFGKDIVPVIMPLIATVIEGTASIISEAGIKSIDFEQIGSALEGRAMDVLLPLYQVEFVDVIINVTWAMAKAADESIEPPKQWVRQFEVFPLDVILPEVADMVLKGFVSSKNLKRLKTIKETFKEMQKEKLKDLQPSHSTKSSSQESKED